MAIYITFTYSSDEADLKAAKKIADEMGHGLIVVGVGSKFNSNSFQSTLGIRPIVANSMDDALADKIVNSICQGQATVPPPKPRPGLGCDYDVMLAMDGSVAFPRSIYSKQISFMREHLAPSWVIDPFHTEVGIGYLEGRSANFGAYMFKYANNRKFDEFLFMYSSKVPWAGTNIASGMESVVQYMKNNRRKGKKIATLAFLYNAKEEDVRKAVKFSRQLALNGDKLIVVTYGAANAKVFDMLSNERIHLTDWNQGSALQLNEAICAPRKPPPAIPSEAPTTAAPATVTTTTAKPSE